MTVQQLDLALPRETPLEEQARRFHEANPHVYELFHRDHPHLGPVFELRRTKA